MPLDHLELQAGIVIVGIPCQQRQPGQYTHRQRNPYARIGQHAPALWQRQQCNEANADDADETVVAEGADHQAQRQLHRR